MIPRLCRPLGDWILRQWVYDANDAATLRALRGARIDWTPPPPVIADPKTETDVAVRQIEAGLASRHGAIRRMGWQPAQIDAEIAADMAIRRDLAALKQPGAAPVLGDQDGDSSQTDTDTRDTPPAADQGGGAIDMNAYGIAVRSGFVTPQIEDEEALRRDLKLPGLSPAARALWEAQGLVRQPVTLKSGAEGKNEAQNADTDTPEEDTPNA
jgi:hypothetical protein